MKKLEQNILEALPKELNLSVKYRHPTPKQRQKDFDSGHNEAIRLCKIVIKQEFERMRKAK